MASTATLTFDDEFNSLSLWNGTSGTWDTTGYWNSLDSNGYTLASNGEQEWYINANYAPTASITPWTVNNGILTLTAAAAPASIQPLINGYQYTSGMVTTDRSFSQTYGYFEERAQLPAGQGLWPAFWLLDENGQWPPEIDAMEMLGNNPGTYYTTVHSNMISGGSVGQADNVLNTSTGYHTYGVDWEPDFITWYFDGQKVFQQATPSDMNQPMYMLTNLAVGGYWPGNVDPSVLPAQMNIDWIRAYSSLPSWIADGSDPTDVNHTPTTAIGSTGSSGGTGTTGGTTTSGTSASNPFPDLQSTYMVPAGMTYVVLTGSGPQTITANDLGDTIVSNDHGSTIIGGSGNDTFTGGLGPDMMTGGAGSDTFVFKVTPNSAGHITDFTPGTDKIDVHAVLSSYGYTGSSPIADGWLVLTDDGAGNTQVRVNPHDPTWPWTYLVTTLDHVAPTSLSLADFGYGSSSSSGGTTTGGTTTGGTTTGGTTTGGTTTGGTTTGGTTNSTPVLDFMATYTVPDGITNIQLAGTTAQTITANNQGDTITSNDHGSTLIGGTGNDTFIAGHGADMLTGGAGSDTFVFDFVPWSAGHVTDFTPGTDKIDLNATLASYGYTGSSPIADGWLVLASDGAGNTQVQVNPHDPSWPYTYLVTTLDHVNPTSLSLADFGYGSSSSSGGTTTGGTTGGTTTGGTTTGGTTTGGTTSGGTTTGGTTTGTPTMDAAATYTVPAGITNVVLTGTGSQTITANNLGDTITSNDHGSTIIGGTGNDTLIAGHGADMLTGGAGSDFFVFNAVPWSAGHITDFTPGTDKIDLNATLASYGYTGSSPIADGWLVLASDGAGNTQVQVNPHDPSWPYTYLITTLDHVNPTSLSLADFGYGSSSSSGGTTTGGTTTGGTTGGTTTGGTTTGGTTTPDPYPDSASTFTIPTNVLHVVLTGTAPQTITANDLGDTITSNNYGSTIIGGAGSDTFIAGTGADHLTGGAGSDTFVFNSLPSQAGHISDFATAGTAHDVLDLSGIFSAIHYTGTNPLKNNWLTFVSDKHGDTNVYVNAHTGAGPILVTTLDHVLPSQITTSDWIWHH